MYYLLLEPIVDISPAGASLSPWLSPWLLEGPSRVPEGGLKAANGPLSKHTCSLMYCECVQAAVRKQGCLWLRSMKRNQCVCFDGLDSCCYFCHVLCFIATCVRNLGNYLYDYLQHVFTQLLIILMIWYFIDSLTPSSSFRATININNMFPGVTNMVKIYICILLTVALIFTAVYKSCSSMETDQSWLEEGGTQTCLLCSITHL